MKNKNGFIAVSLIYSFFLVFLMIMLSSSIKNAQTRILMSTIKNDIKAELNKEAEFVVTTLANKTYGIGEEVNFVGESWLVVKDNSNSVVLVLKRALNKEEITTALEIDAINTDYFAGSCNDTGCKVKMCMTKYYDNICYFQSTSNFVYYNWDNSIAKEIVENWFENNINLQKVCRLQYNATLQKQICSKNTLLNMTFSDGVASRNGYIRLPTNDEAALGLTSWVVNDGGYSASDAWTITSQNATNGKSLIYDIKGLVNQNENVKSIRPVIEVQKYS